MLAGLSGSLVVFYVCACYSGRLAMLAMWTGCLYMLSKQAIWLAMLDILMAD
jgi:hypothetical protein